MPATILGLDIGGANLKAATPDKRAVSVPFPLWKQPEKLPSALENLVSQFSDAAELAVTMTGELCDCFETKRQGVQAIIAAVRSVSEGRRIRVWSTDGVFLDSEEARQNHMKVAAANWHALATLAGQYVPKGRAILLDIGSTTTDIIPILDGLPVPKGKTDAERLESWELVYTGVRRTPLCALMGWNGAAELFATTLDAYLALGLILENEADCDTADGRPATRAYARARLCRMYCGDTETVAEETTQRLAEWICEEQSDRISRCLDEVRRGLLKKPSHYEVGRVPDEEKQIIHILSGSGEFLARMIAQKNRYLEHDISLSDKLGPAGSSCAPAYAVAVLATEGPSTECRSPSGANLLRGLWPWSRRS